MEIHFKSAHTKDVVDEVTPKVTAVAERKLVALKKYLGKQDGAPQVYVELGKVTEAHHTGDIWRSQINLDSNGKRYNAAATAERLDLAIDASVKELEAELRKSKKRSETMLRRGGVTLKSFMRGFKAR
jgi:ribosomal subunit interface protein